MYTFNMKINIKKALNEIAIFSFGTNKKEISIFLENAKPKIELMDENNYILWNQFDGSRFLFNNKNELLDQLEDFISIE